MEISRIRLRATLAGLASALPGHRLAGKERGRGSARSCYSVWLRHLVVARRSGVVPDIGTVLEIGPGGSLGVGLAALLSGAESCIAVDAVPHTAPEENVSILDEMADLLARRAPVPDDDEFPELQPRLRSYAFPAGLVDEGVLNPDAGIAALPAIRDSLLHPATDDPRMIRIVARPELRSEQRFEGVSLILSQAALEHVDDLDGMYRAMRGWLRPGGAMAHTIDYRCHGLASRWNGHWTYSDLAWKAIRGRRPYLINREPHSTHLRLLERHGFALANEITVPEPSAIARRELAGRFRDLSDADLTTSVAHVVARPR